MWEKLSKHGQKKNPSDADSFDDRQPSLSKLENVTGDSSPK